MKEARSQNPESRRQENQEYSFILAPGSLSLYDLNDLNDFYDFCNLDVG